MRKFCDKTYTNKAKKPEDGYSRGYKVSQECNKPEEAKDGKQLWKYTVECWENGDHKNSTFEQYE